MSRHDIDPITAEEWLEGSRRDACTQFADLRAHHDTLARRTHDLYSRASDSEQWDTLHAVLRYIAVLLITFTCAGIGVWAAVSLR